MGKLINALKRLPKRTSAIVAIVAAAIVVPATLFAWGPERPTYTINNPADHITFNSITDNPNIGDERNFVGIRENGTNGTWQDNITVQPGKEYVVRMYVHNNAASSLNLVAENVTAMFNLPTNTAKSIQVNGFLSASNATPKEVYDHAVMNSNKDFNLAYQAGTLKYFTNASGPNGFTIPESVFTSAGAKLGYDKLDGKIPGCFQYAGYLTFIVKPQFAPEPKPDFAINKQVRKDGSGAAFAESTNVMPGDTVNYRIEVKNTGDGTINNVILKDKLPTGMTFVPGTVKILNANNPGGAYIQDGDKIVTTGVNIGHYSPGSNALVIFNAKVAANDQLPVCGPNKLTNIASAQPEGQNPKEDGADVNVPKECKPEAKYTCDSLTVTKIERTKFKFDTKYTLQNATLKKLEYVIRDENGAEIARQTSADYTQDKVGKYTVQAILTVTVDGQDKTVTSENCKKPFEVEKVPETPAYTCDALTVNKISRMEYSFTGKATATGGATIVNYTFDFGDGTNQTVTNPTDVKHTYAKDGTYTAKLSVKVKVDNAEKTVTDDKKCVVKVTITPEECKPGIPVGDERCEEKPECKPGIPVGDERCEEKPECKPGIPVGDARCEEKPENCPIPGKEMLPKDSPDCKEVPETPKELPKTGAGDGIVALFGAGSLIAALGYYIASRRALGV